MLINSLVYVKFIIKVKKHPNSKNKKYLTNLHIHFKEVKLIDENNKFVGIIPTLDAQSMAENASLDLVLINSRENPPIAKILDFGKFLYEENKKERKSKTKQKEVELKEIRLSFNLSSHDRDVKLKKSIKFLKQGHNIRVGLKLKGRENIFRQKSFEIIEQFINDLGPNIEKIPQKHGKNIDYLIKLIHKKNETQNPQSEQ